MALRRVAGAKLFITGFIVSAWAVTPAAEAGIVEGVQEVVVGVLSPPLGALQGTFSGPPLFGTLVGALQGTVNGVGLITHGVLQIVGGAIPLAKAAAPFVLPFLF